MLRPCLQLSLHCNSNTHSIIPPAVRVAPCGRCRHLVSFFFPRQLFPSQFRQFLFSTVISFCKAPKVFTKGLAKNGGFYSNAHLVCHFFIALEGQGQCTIDLVVSEAAEVLDIVGGAILELGIALRLVDAHGPLPAALLAIFGARAGHVAIGLAVLVEVGLRVTAPALPAVLGRDKLGTLAVFDASLSVHREQRRGSSQRGSRTTHFS